MNKPLEYLNALGAACVVLSCGVASSPLQAATACSFNSAALHFPAYDAFHSGPTDGTGSVNVNCTNLGTSSVSGSSIVLGIGSSTNGTAGDRRMATASSTADKLRYGIYRDAARSQNWDQGSNTVVQRLGTLQAQETKAFSFTLFGRIAPLQNVRAGSYHDLLTLTITP